MRALAQAGQATVEFVALVPLLVAVGAAVLAVLAAGRASAAAGAAAEAGAVALLQGASAPEAAHRSLAGWPEGSTIVRVRGGRVHVSVRPQLPLLARALTADAVADAGPVAPPAGPLLAIRGGDGASAAHRCDRRRHADGDCIEPGRSGGR